MKKDLVIVDMSVKRGSPAGSCVRTLLLGLNDAGGACHLFSADWDGADAASHVRWHRVAAPESPVAWRYVVFHTRVKRALNRWLTGRSRDGVLVQATQGQWVGADVVYAHFCHGAYLPSLLRQGAWTHPRFLSRVLTHVFNAWRERLALAKAKVIVAPSRGLVRELVSHYGLPESKIRVLANPVDVARFSPPPRADKAMLQQQHGLNAAWRWMSFMALGDFERKGLGVLLKGWAKTSPQVRDQIGLLVIGGQQAEIEAFRALAAELDLAHRVVFVGMQADVRPYLWATDVFAFPSAYEIFSLAILQAAAAGLPVLVTQGLYGAEEFVTDGVNGWQVSRDDMGVQAALTQWIEMSDAQVAGMGQCARESVAQYSQEAFVQKWQAVYQELGLE